RRDCEPRGPARLDAPELYRAGPARAAAAPRTGRRGPGGAPAHAALRPRAAPRPATAAPPRPAGGGGEPSRPALAGRDGGLERAPRRSPAPRTRPGAAEPPLPRAPARGRVLVHRARVARSPHGACRGGAGPDQRGGPPSLAGRAARPGSEEGRVTALALVL